MGDMNSIEPASVEALAEDGQLESSSRASKKWRVIAAKLRVDSFNQIELENMARAAREEGCRKIALDLKANRFFSFQAIRFFVDMARDLAQANGELALIGCSEKTKRHFEIYGSLDHIRMVRTLTELEDAGDTVLSN